MKLEELKSVLKNVIPKQYPYWVLLSNGTFLVLDSAVAAIQKDIKSWTLELLRELETHKLTVFAFVDDIVHVSDCGGWIVTNRYGAYTYVHNNEFSEPDPSELAISVKGCIKFMQDCIDKEIMHIEFPNKEGLGNR
jgi:ABC-type Mn2+/Zn2+ transport system ATPase subunit